MEKIGITLTIEEARLIRAILIRYPFGQLSCIYYGIYNPNYGNDFAGMGLMMEAARLLGIDMNHTYKYGDDARFDTENLTYMKKFGFYNFWWEI